MISKCTSGKQMTRFGRRGGGAKQTSRGESVRRAEPVTGGPSGRRCPRHAHILGPIHIFENRDHKKFTVRFFVDRKKKRKMIRFKLVGFLTTVINYYYVNIWQMTKLSHFNFQ